MKKATTPTPRTRTELPRNKVVLYSKLTSGGRFGAEDFREPETNRGLGRCLGVKNVVAPGVKRFVARGRMLVAAERDKQSNLGPLEGR